MSEAKNYEGSECLLAFSKIFGKYDEKNFAGQVAALCALGPIRRPESEIIELITKHANEKWGATIADLDPTAVGVCAASAALAFAGQSDAHYAAVVKGVRHLLDAGRAES